MFRIDRILLAPVVALGAIAAEIAQAVDQEVASESESVTADLRDAYRALEEGMLTEDAFAERERELLDRLESLAGRAEP